MTSASRTLTSFLAAMLACSLAAEPASASPAGSEAELDSHTRTAARSLAAQGSAAFEAQRYAEALDLFDRAAAIVEAPTIALMQARTLEKLGRWVEAADRYASIQRWKDANGAALAANPTFGQAVDAAQQELLPLMQRIPKLNVKVAPVPVDGVELYVNGRKLLPALVGADIPVDPGQCEVEARRPGHETIVRQTTLAEGTREEVTISLEETRVLPAGAPATQPAVPPPVRADSRGASSNDTLGLVLLGAGVAGAATGVVTGIVALGKKSELDEVCSPGCPPSQAETLDSYRVNRTLSYVGFAVGIAGVSAGGYLLLSGTKEEPGLALGVAPGAAKVWGRF